MFSNQNEWSKQETIKEQIRKNQEINMNKPKISRSVVTIPMLDAV